MRPNQRRSKFCGLVLLLSLLAGSCKKEGLDTRYLQVYTSAEAFPTNEIDLTYGYFTDGTTYGLLQQSIPVSITKATSADVTVEFHAVDSLVAAYNQQNGTHFLPAPAAAYTISDNGSVTIRAGKLTPATDLTLTLTNAFKYSDTTGYLLALGLDKLKSADKGATLSPGQSVLYFKILPNPFLLSVEAKNGDNDSVKTARFYRTPSGKAIFRSTPVVFGHLNQKAGAAFSQLFGVGDAAAVSAYNNANNTMYPLLPAADYIFSDSKLNFQISVDTSAPLLLSTLSNTDQLTAKSYLLPIFLQSGPAYVNPKKMQAYVRVEIDSIIASLKINTGSTDSLLSIPYAFTPNGAVSPPPDTVQLLINQGVAFPVGARVVPGDAAAVTAYNTANSTNYLPLPADNYTLTGNITVQPAQTQAPVAIAVKNVQSLDTAKSYLLPLLLQANDTIFKDGKNSALFVTVKGVYNNVDASNSGLTGSTMNRAAWAVTGDDPFGISPPNVLDGDSTTSWIAFVPGSLQLDMGASNTVKGFSIIQSSYFGSPFGDITSMQVYSSADGVTWTSQGIYSGPAGGTKTVKFIQAVTARYFKFNITSSPDGYSGMAELNGVQ